MVDVDYSAGIQIVAPSKVTKIGKYLDGGSIGGILKDARGNKIAFWWDGGSREDTPEARAFPRLLYIGSDRSHGKENYPVPVGSQGESDLIQAFSWWVDSVIPPSEQERVYSIYFDHTLRVEDRMKLLPSFNEEKARAMQTLYLVRTLEEQRVRLGKGGTQAGIGL